MGVRFEKYKAHHVVRDDKEGYGLVESALEHAEIDLGYCLSIFNEDQTYTPERQARLEKLLEEMEELRTGHKTNAGSIIAFFDEDIKDIVRAA